jgi:phosphoenolpyruvate---glycerone phosphotransferase subunit DhaK
LKKLMNDPNAFAAEALEGLAQAYPQYVRKIEGLAAVTRKDAPITGKVAVLTGGGSGHEPMFAGFVGPGWADASVAGNVFTSPPPPPICAAAKAVHGGAGVLLLYGNYAGDVLNFDTAAAMLAEDGIQVSTVRIGDDVASAPPERRDERRGIAGDFLVIKAACARAEERAGLAEVTSVAKKANDCTRSMGVALTSCVIPASGRPIFALSDQEMEIGMGLHGEPGVRRGPLASADPVAKDMVSRILADLPAKAGDEVAVLVNGLGATPLSELFIMFRAAHRCLSDAGLTVWQSYVGSFATSLDMAGCSLTIMRLESELKRLLSAPAQSPAFVQAG